MKALQKRILCFAGKKAKCFQKIKEWRPLSFSLALPKKQVNLENTHEIFEKINYKIQMAKKNYLIAIRADL